MPAKVSLAYSMRFQDQKFEVIELKEEITACTDTMIGNRYVCDLK